jgi:hypothetical protein
MTFYKECPGGDLSLTSIGESPMEMHFPEYFQEKISPCSLQSEWRRKTAQNHNGNYEIIMD